MENDITKIIVTGCGVAEGNTEFIENGKRYFNP